MGFFSVPRNMGGCLSDKKIGHFNILEKAIKMRQTWVKIIKVLGWMEPRSLQKKFEIA